MDVLQNQNLQNETEKLPEHDLETATDKIEDQGLETATDKLQDLEIGEDSKALYKMFKEYDINNDGELCKEEIKDLIRVCGFDPTDEDLDEYMGQYDDDGDKKISFEEFVTFIDKQKEKGDPAENLRQAFSFYDKDGSGFLDRDELKGMLSKVCSSDEGDEGMIDELIECLDTNGDGKIQIDELTKKMRE